MGKMPQIENQVVLLLIRQMMLFSTGLLRKKLGSTLPLTSARLFHTVDGETEVLFNDSKVAGE